LTVLPSSFFFARNETTPIGCIEVQAGLNGLWRVDLLGHAFSSRNGKEIQNDQSGLARKALDQILEYLHGSRRVFDLEIDWSLMKPFQIKVLNRALQIPFGQTLTYGQLAVEFGTPAASRAVGGALAHNPLPIVIPCHRVVAANGALTGFSAAEGIRTKKWLLELEGHNVVGEKLV